MDPGMSVIVVISHLEGCLRKQIDQMPSAPIVMR